MLDKGVARNRAELARMVGVSRSRITQILGRRVSR
jgi:DNA-directed RNA polymerase specialized sigma subunit